MKRGELARLAVIIIVAGVFSFIVSSSLFSSPAKRSTMVPEAQPIATSFPDVRHDPQYSFFLNSNALDPTVPIQIGNSHNSAPFNSSGSQ